MIHLSLIFNRYCTFAMDRHLWGYKIAKLKNPGLDIPEPEPQPQSSNNTSNQEMPPSPPRQRRRWNNTPPSAKSNSEILEVFQTLNLESCATSREVKIKFRQLSRIYHPDKHDSGKTGISNTEALEFFQKSIMIKKYLLTITKQINLPLHNKRQTRKAI